MKWEQTANASIDHAFLNSIKIDIQTTDIEHRLQLTVRWNPTDMQKPIQRHPVTDMEPALLLVARIPPIHVKNITSTFSSAPRFCSGSSISIHSRSLIVQRSVRHLRSRKRSAMKKRNTKKKRERKFLTILFSCFHNAFYHLHWNFNIEVAITARFSAFTIIIKNIRSKQRKEGANTI